MVEELRQRAIDGLLSLPKRGREIGGLLLGRVERGSVSIEGLQEIPCEHRFGPSYVLSGPDRELLKSEMERQPNVIGMYRSYCRRELALDAPDRDVIQKFFPNGDAVFLLLEPISPLECSAAFAFPRDGQVAMEPPYPPFRFDAAALETKQEPEPRQVAEAPAFTQAPAPATRRFWLPLIACIAVAVVAAFVYELWKMAAEPQYSELHLDALPKAGAIELHWDRAAAPVLLSSRAVLTVSDGVQQKRIDLNAADVRGGKYEYRPEHPNVLFRMAIYSTGIKPWSDSLRVLSMAEAPVAPAPPRPALAPQTPARSGEASRAVELPRVAVSAPVALHEVQPEIPEGIRSRIEAPVTVPVAVHVSPAGTVTSAVASGHGDSAVYRYLAVEAAKAARSWRFTPAKGRDGAAVASTKTIEFTFAP